jgi:hypothetical protein
VTAIAAGVLALLSLLLFVRISPTTAWLRVALDASHGPIFAGVAILLVLLLEPSRRPDGEMAWPDWVRCGKVLVLCVVIGAFIEFLQGFEGRPPSFFDVMTDTAGALVGLGAWSLATWPRAGAVRGSSRHGARSVVALALAGVVFILWQPMHAATAYAHRAAIFPAIAEFERPLDLYFTTTDAAAARITELPAPWSRQPGERALELRYGPGHPPAVQVVEPSGDWRRYGVIAVDLTNVGSAELSLVFRILDTHHDWTHEDRLNLPLVIPPRTRTTVRVTLDAVATAPASRPMDMARIANVMLFGRDPASAGALYVSRIWLE